MYNKLRVKRKNNKAFTLAEVLVTLMVIGVVAAMTISPMIKNMQNAQFAAGAKEAVSIVNRATQRMMADNGGTLGGNCFVGTSQHVQAFACYTQYLNIVKDCGTGTGCFYNDGSVNPYKYLNKADWRNLDTATLAKAILNNGMSIALYDSRHDCVNKGGDSPVDKSCGSIYIDINRNKGPNILGRDIMIMFITKTGVVVPGGSSCLNSFRPYYGSDFSQSCNPAIESGIGCLARILREGKIDY